MAALVAAALTLACGDGDRSAEATSETTGTTGSARSQADAATPAPPSQAPPSEGTEGSVTFEVDGEAYAFDFLPAENNFAMSMASAVVAHTEPGSTAEFRIAISGIDLHELELPADIPPANAGTSLETARMVVAFSFTDPSGEEWAGSARLHVESFNDSETLVATFAEVELFHTDRERPPVTLTNGRVRAQLN